MITELDERRVEKIAKERSLVDLIQRGKHTPPFPREVWYEFDLISGGRKQMIGEYVPAYERAYVEAIEYLQDIDVLTIIDDGAYVVLDSKDRSLNPNTPDSVSLYFVNKEDAEQYSSIWHSFDNVRVRKLSSE